MSDYESFLAEKAITSPLAGLSSLPSLATHLFPFQVALQNGRRFIGAELKKSYFEQACANLGQAKRAMGDLFETAS